MALTAHPSWCFSTGRPRLPRPCFRRRGERGETNEHGETKIKCKWKFIAPGDRRRFRTFKYFINFLLASAATPGSRAPPPLPRVRHRRRRRRRHDDHDDDDHDNDEDYDNGDDDYDHDYDHDCDDTPPRSRKKGTRVLFTPIPPALPCPPALYTHRDRNVIKTSKWLWIASRVGSAPRHPGRPFP
jgi:hypothetical protein